MPTYRLDIAYDGSGFHGYASQPAVRTVQGVLEQALFHHTGTVETAVAGRTDKGVHARGQVVSFEADLSDLDRVVRSLNRQLAPEIAIQSLAEAPPAFHARFSAKGRVYCYRILNRPSPDPFRAATSWHYEPALDVSEMTRAAGYFVGEQDFASFCRKSADRPTVRDVTRAIWSADDDMALFDIAASSFCHQMVRSVVAVCVDVGRGRLGADEVPAIIAARDRQASKGAAPPHGLTLESVEY